MKKKINYRVVLAFVALVILATFLVAAFEGIGYVFVNGSVWTRWRLHNLAASPTGSYKLGVHGLAITSIVLAWLVLPMPLASLLWTKKYNFWIGIIVISAITLAFIFALISEGIFVSNQIPSSLDLPREAGVWVLILVGGIFSIWASFYAYFPNRLPHFKKKKKAIEQTSEAVLVEDDLKAPNRNQEF